jgi:hypothetical protein
MAARTATWGLRRRNAVFGGWAAVVLGGVGRPRMSRTAMYSKLIACVDGDH